MRTSPEHPSGHAPVHAEQGDNHLLPYPRYTNFTPAPHTYINHDHLLGMHNERLAREAEEKMANKPYYTHDIRKCRPILPGDPRLVLHPSPDFALGKTEGATSSQPPPAVTVEDRDESERVQVQAQATQIDDGEGQKAKDTHNPWGRKTEAVPYTQEELHVSRSEIWLDHFESEKAGKNNTEPFYDAAFYHFFADGTCGSPAEHIHYGFELGQADTLDVSPSTRRSTSRASSSDGAVSSSQTSTTDPHNSVSPPCNANLTHSFFNATDDMPRCMTDECYDLRTLDRELAAERERVCLVSEKENQRFCMINKCYDLRVLDQQLAEEARLVHLAHDETKKTALAASIKVVDSPFSANKKRVSMTSENNYHVDSPPEFLARTMRDIGRPNAECMTPPKPASSEHVTTMFAKIPITSPTSLRSGISSAIIHSRSTSADSSDDLMMGTHHPLGGQADGHDSTGLMRRRLANFKARRIIIQKASDCDEGITSDSESENESDNCYNTETNSSSDQNSDDKAFDSFDWDAPLTPEVNPATKACQEADRLKREIDEAHKEALRQEIKRRGVLKEAAAKKEAKKKAQKKAGKAAWDSFQAFQAQKEAQEKLKKEHEARLANEERGGRPAERGSTTPKPKREDSPCTAHARATAIPLVDRDARPQMMRCGPGLNDEAMLDDLARRAAHPAFMPKLQLPDEPFRTEYTETELAQERNRDVRFGWNLVDIDYDGFTEEAMKMESETDNPCLWL